MKTNNENFLKLLYRYSYAEATGTKTKSVVVKPLWSVDRVEC